MYIRNKNIMGKMKIIVAVLLSLISKSSFSQTGVSILTQTSDSTHTKQTPDTVKPLSLEKSIEKINEKRIVMRSLIFPASLTAYGIVALENEKLESLDNWVKQKVWDNKPHQPAHFDDALQYMPGLSVYVLNGLGISGKNNLLDATRQYLISSFLMMVVVQSGKAITRLRRPDGFGTNTFPGGHTATAFVAAEFLHQEFKDKSPWISIAGYSMATIVGYMRIYNNRHWLKDDIAGAGIGMGITRLVYWIYPKVKYRIFKDKSSSTILLPYYQKGAMGLSLVHNF